MIGLGSDIGTSKVERRYYKIFLWLAIILVPVGIIMVLYDISGFDNMDIYLGAQKKPGFTLTKIGSLLIIIPPVMAFGQRIYLKTALELEAKK